MNTIIHSIRNLTIFKKKAFNALTKANGLKLAFDKNKDSINILNQVFINRTYAPYFPFYATATIVDAGAHYGYFTLFAHQHSDKNSKIICLEPDAENVALLQQHLKDNGVTNATLIQKALGNTSEPAKLFKGQSHTYNHSTMPQEQYAFSGTEHKQVESTTLEALVQDYGTIDFLKMDIEGAEYPVLLHATKEAMQHIKVLSLEFHHIANPAYSPNALIKKMTGFGFELKKFDFLPNSLNYNLGQMVFVNTSLWE